MALKATIYKADLQLSDIDRGVYGDYPLTIARHPSETDERLMVRLLAFALSVPADGDHGPLEFAKDLWDADEPSLWQRDFTGRLVHWIELGQPDDKRLSRVCARVDQVSVFSYASSTPIWWEALAPKISRLRNLTVWQIPSAQSEALALLAKRSMQLNVTVQDGGIWMSDQERSVEVQLTRLTEATV